jgi:hypothetical protein
MFEGLGKKKRKKKKKLGDPEGDLYGSIARRCPRCGGLMRLNIDTETYICETCMQSVSEPPTR